MSHLSISAVPGSYQARLKVGDWTQTKSFHVLKDPILETTQADFEEQFRLLVEIREKINETHGALGKIRDLRQQVQDFVKRIAKADQGEEDLIGEAETVVNNLTAIEVELNQTKSESRQDPINFPPKLDNQLVYLYGLVNGSDHKPTNGAVQRFNDLKAELASHLGRLEEVINTDVTAFNARIREKGATPIVTPEL
jgi:iron-sulfur cluster repair protein YtfE (RIC family)